MASSTDGNERLSEYPHIGVEMRGAEGELADVMAYVHGSPEEIKLLQPFLEEIAARLREVDQKERITAAAKKIYFALGHKFLANPSEEEWFGFYCNDSIYHEAARELDAAGMLR